MTTKQWQIDNPGYESFKPGYVLKFEDTELILNSRSIAQGRLMIFAAKGMSRGPNTFGRFQVDSPTQITANPTQMIHGELVPNTFAGKTFNLVDGRWTVV